MKWEPTLNALAITFEGRITPAWKLIMIQIRFTLHSTIPKRLIVAAAPSQSLRGL